MLPYATLDSTYTRELRLSLKSVDVDLLETGPHTADEGGPWISSLSGESSNHSHSNHEDYWSGSIVP